VCVVLCCVVLCELCGEREVILSSLLSISNQFTTTEPVDALPIGRNIRRTPDGRMQITVTPEQKAGLDNLIHEGFSQEEVLEAFLECDQDIDAAEKLLKHGVKPARPAGGFGGLGHGHSHGHFSPEDGDLDDEEDLPSSNRAGLPRSPLARTPIPPSPTKSRKKKNVTWDVPSLVVGAAILAAVGGAVAYYMMSGSKKN